MTKPRYGRQRTEGNLQDDKSVPWRGGGDSDSDKGPFFPDSGEPRGGKSVPRSTHSYGKQSRYLSDGNANAWDPPSPRDTGDAFGFDIGKPAKPSKYSVGS